MDRSLPVGNDDQLLIMIHQSTHSLSTPDFRSTCSLPFDCNYTTRDKQHHFFNFAPVLYIKNIISHFYFEEKLQKEKDGYEFKQAAHQVNQTFTALCIEAHGTHFKYVSSCTCTDLGAVNSRNKCICFPSIQTTK